MPVQFATRALLSLVLLVCASGPGQAQTASFGNQDQPLEIFADQGIEWRREERVYIARGNAEARQGDVTLHADVLQAYYRGEGDSGDITLIEARGNVRIISPDTQVYGQRGTYDVPRDIMRMTGKGLKLESGDDVVTAEDSLEYRSSQRLAIAKTDALALEFDPLYFAGAHLRYEIGIIAHFGRLSADTTESLHDRQEDDNDDDKYKNVFG